MLASGGGSGAIGCSKSSHIALTTAICCAVSPDTWLRVNIHHDARAKGLPRVSRLHPKMPCPTTLWQSCKH
eukprot:12917246-Prorocentrum_lima.AAC.1